MAVLGLFGALGVLVLALGAQSFDKEHGGQGSFLRALLRGSFKGLSWVSFKIGLLQDLTRGTMRVSLQGSFLRAPC